MNNFGCPATEQRTRMKEFEESEFAVGMDLSMRKDAPHYDNHNTRIAFYKFDFTIKKE